MVVCLAKELVMRKDELTETVETIYFGGGTPSLLTIEEVEFLIDTIYQNYQVAENPEISLEANPDDLTEEKIIQLSQTPINRLSIGVQSFFEDDLKTMNRAHTAVESENCIRQAQRYFENFTIDLIYGIPKMSVEKWRQNLEKALALNIPHLSGYALTVEPKTALKKMIEKGSIPPVDEVLAEQHYRLLTEIMAQNDYVNYEFSNFGKPGYFSKNNTAYWTGKKYLGIGPSAHSFDGNSRSWNISNNTLYIKNISSGNLPSEREIMTVTNRYNEYIMTGLRTIFGVSLEKVRTDFGEKYLEYIQKQAQNLLDDGLLSLTDNILKITPKGKFISDCISAELFFLD